MGYATSTQTNTASGVTLGHALAAPFRAIGRLLVRLADADPRTAEIAKLNATSDEELAAKGTTRVAEVRRLFASSGLV